MTDRLHPRQEGSGRNPRMPCPHCKSRTEIRESRVHHQTYREITYQCTNPHCGCSFVCSLEVMREIRPSGTPNRELRIRQSPRQIPPSPYLSAPPDEAAPRQTGPPSAGAEPITLPLPF